MAFNRRAALALISATVALLVVVSSATHGAQAYPSRSKVRLSSVKAGRDKTAITNATTTSTSTSTTSTTLLPVVPDLTRVAADWPFSADSPWNLGVGTGATFESATDAKTANLISTAYTPWVNAGQYSHPIYKASDSDPMASVSRTGHPTDHYLIPNGATAAKGTDMHMHVVEPNGRYLHESWKMQGSNPTWTTGYHVRTDLWGPGVGERGVRAYGGSAVGGLIRKWELDQGEIRHAIALALTSCQLKAGYVWPATAQDGGGATTYCGQVPMGSFAAIPRSIDVSTLGLSREGLIVAKALQDYGTYVVDRSGSFTFYTDPVMDGTTALSHMRADMDKLRAQLRIVTNNSSTSVNGGGIRWVAPAPAFG